MPRRILSWRCAPVVIESTVDDLFVRIARFVTVGNDLP